MRKIKIFTNQVANGWEPADLKTFLGGSEESVVLLAEALTRKEFEVTVYHNQVISKDKNINGVLYKSREQATCDQDDIFITFKDVAPWKMGAKAALNIHWTTEIEKSWGSNPDTGERYIDNIDHYINISKYQQGKNSFVPNSINKAFPLGVDLESLNKNKAKTEKNTLLYCSSPDRGLLQLLKDWKFIKQKSPDLKLKVAYGWGNFNTANPEIRKFKDTISKLLNQDGITYLGSLDKTQIEKEYWKAAYWVLPLNNPNSELFCLNAVKARHCGCTPIVNKVGALSETVGDFIDYHDFINKGLSNVQKEEADYKAISWDNIVEQYWLPILKD